MTEQMTKKSKDYSGEGLRRVVWVDDKSFKGMMIFTWVCKSKRSMIYKGTENMHKEKPCERKRGKTSKIE